MKNPLRGVVIGLKGLCVALNFFFILLILIFMRIFSQRATIAVARFWARCFLCILGVRLHRIGSFADWQNYSIILCNHLAYLDIPVVLASFRRPFIFIADHSIFRVPGLSLAMRLCGCISIRQGSPSSVKKCLARAEERIRAGWPVVIFPEGGINRTGDVHTLIRINFGFKLTADNTGATVYQMSLYGCEKAQSRLYKFRQHVGVYFHPEVFYHGKGAQGCAAEREENLPGEEKQVRKELADLLTARNREAVASLAAKIDRL